jgi:hypothetical protein
VSGLLNFADRTFASAATYATPDAAPGSVSLSDLNGDGKPDFVGVFNGAAAAFMNRVDRCHSRRHSDKKGCVSPPGPEGVVISYKMARRSFLRGCGKSAVLLAPERTARRDDFRHCHGTVPPRAVTGRSIFASGPF